VYPLIEILYGKSYEFEYDKEKIRVSMEIVFLFDIVISLY